MLPLLLKFAFELFQVWPRDRVVQLLSHPGMLNLTYPCVTNQDGTDPGDLIRKVCFLMFPQENPAHSPTPPIALDAISMGLSHQPATQGFPFLTNLTFLSQVP